jgi:ABC-type polysaccharide/polyol phosphate export permease
MLVQLMFASSAGFVEAVRQLLEDTFYQVFFFSSPVSFNCSFRQLFIRDRVGVAPIEEKLIQHRLR